jgi:hypothetical protein
MSKQAEFKVMTTKLRKNQKRAAFQDVIESLSEQMAELGDLDNALLIAPKGATHRQVALALRRIEADQ